MALMDLLPVMVYVLVIILLVILIILGIKLIIFVDKTDKLVDDVSTKVKAFDGVFNIMALTSDKLSIGITSLVDGIVSLVKKIFKKKKEEDYYE